MARKTWIAGLTVSLIVGLFIGFIAGGAMIEDKVEKVIVPQVVGMQRNEAQNTLAESGFESTIKWELTDDPGEVGKVAYQDPFPETELSKGSTVKITVLELDRSAGNNVTSKNAQTTTIQPAEIRYLAAGTGSQTPLYIIRGRQAGPKMLVLGGVHGDEPAAYYSGNVAARLRLDKGTLFVIPNLNVIAQAKGTREGIGDINRKFPGNPAGDPEERLCFEVCELAKNEQIDLVLTFHEAIGYMQTSSNPGQTLYYDWDINPYAGKSLTQEANTIINNVNMKIRELPGFQTKELFATYVDPIPKSATYALMEECGVDYALGCEVAKVAEPSRRVWFHLTFLVTWMEQRGLIVNNWNEVENQIWSGDFTELR